MILKADCRAENIVIQPGETSVLTREEHGEECAIQLEINDEIEYEQFISDYRIYFLTVTEDGSIDDPAVAI